MRFRLCRFQIRLQELSWCTIKMEVAKFKEANYLKNLLALTGRDLRPDSQYNPEDLSRGIEVELEHTNDREIAKKITKDHLDERPDYYAVLSTLSL